MSEEDSYASDLTDAEWALIAPQYAGGQAFGPATRDRVAVRTRCDLVHRADRLSVADAAEGFSAVHYRARLFLRLARGTYSLSARIRQFSVERHAFVLNQKVWDNLA